ncbi:MAG: NAD(P)/FAD-dependent oxidoreductase [Candidatus Lokiarchaeota archaeon]|nr:NAD(P)/FAD-dependent oxidoreductase [Candidatus Lokiarchaeota archaeon]
MTNKYDVIVIGSGIGGSAAAALMAHAGKKTLLLEKNDYIGGVTSSYTKEGFTIDQAIHFFPAGLNGRFGKILKRIGMLETTSLKFNSHLENKTGFKLRGSDKIITGNLMMGMVGQGKKTSSEKSSQSADPSSVVTGFGFTKEDQKDLMNFFGKILQMSRKKIIPLYEEKCTLTEYVNRFTKNPVVHNLVAFVVGGMFTISPRISSAAEFIWGFQEMITNSNLSYPDGASVAVPKAFIEGMEKFGGKLKTNARVSKILVENNKAIGVVSNDQDYYADIIISNASIKNTVHLANEENFDKDYRDRVNNLKPSYSSITFKAALKKPIIEDICMLNLFHGELSNIDSDSSSSDRKAKTTGFMSVIPSNCDPSLAPKGKQLIIFGTMSPVEGVKDWKKWLDLYYKDILSYIPEIEDNLLFLDSTTPHDLVKINEKAMGPVESTALTPEQSGPYRISSELPVKNLYVVGDSAGTNTHGVGTQLATDSAIKCVDMILKGKS